MFHNAGLVPPERIGKMLASFDASGSEGDYGVRETYPYINPNLTMGQAPACCKPSNIAELSWVASN